MRERLVQAGSFLSGDVAARALAFAVLLAGARVLGPAEFGRFALVMAVVSICQVISDFGLTLLAMRRLSAEPKRQRAIFWSASIVNLTLATGVYAVTLVAFGVAAPHYLTLVCLYGIVVFFQALATSADALLFARDRAARVGVNRFTGNVVLCAAGALALMGPRSAVGLLLAFVVATFAKFALSMVAVRPLVGRPMFDSQLARALLRAAVPFALSAAVGFLYFRVDMVLLAALASDESVGNYAAAYRFVDGLLLVPAALAYACFPGWMRSQEARRQTFLLLKLLTALGVFAGVLALLIGPLVLELVLGSQFGDGARALAILALAIPILYVDSVAVWIAYSRGLEWSVIKICAVALAINVALNVALIPRYDVLGAAIATVVSEVAAFAGYAFLFRALVARHQREIAAAAAQVAVAVSAAAGTVLLLDIGSFPPPVHAAAAGSALVAAFAATRFLTPGDRRNLSQGRDA